MTAAFDPFAAWELLLAAALVWTALYLIGTVLKGRP